MKRYKLLKDLPFAKAGEIFESRILDDGEEYLFWGEIKTEKIENFDDWFEEIGSFFWTISYSTSRPCKNYYRIYDWEYIEKLKSTGNFFTTEQEAEKHLEWLKARVVLLEDTKGFKPDWNSFSQKKCCVEYNYGDYQFITYYVGFMKAGEIYFETREDAEKSIKTHEKEWKIYLQCQD